MSLIVKTTKIALEHLKDVIPDTLCRRSHYPVVDIQELEDVKQPVILVVPVERSGSMVRSKGIVDNDIFIDICINAKLQQIDNDNPEASTEEIDSYIDIAERIYAHFHKVEKESDGFQVTFLNPEHKLLNDFDMIRRMNCFISVIRVKAKVFDKQFQF